MLATSPPWTAEGEAGGGAVPAVAVPTLLAVEMGRGGRDAVSNSTLPAAIGRGGVSAASLPAPFAPGRSSNGESVLNPTIAHTTAMSPPRARISFADIIGPGSEVAVKAGYLAVRARLVLTIHALSRRGALHALMQINLGAGASTRRPHAGAPHGFMPAGATCAVFSPISSKARRTSPEAFASSMKAPA